jgi:thioredoxin 1
MESDKNIEKKETGKVVESVKNVEEKTTNNAEDKTVNNVVVIDFFAEWCGPCKMQDPVIDEMKRKFEGMVKFEKIDVDNNRELANKYNVMAIPTLIVEKNGSIFKKYVGLTGSKVLEDIINDALK